jgi:hypothetical protein
MALVLADRVQDVTTTTGTGTVTLANTPPTGFQSFAVIGNGNTTYYAIYGGNDWEVGIGAYTAIGTSLSRDTVLASSNSGNLVNFGSGDKAVFVTYPAERSVNEDASGNVNINITGSAATATTATNLAAGAGGSIPYQTAANTTTFLVSASGVLVGGNPPTFSTTPTLTGSNFTAIPNAALSNSAVTVGTTAISLGATSTTLAGLVSVTLTQDPTLDLQAATKQYVDTVASTGIHFHQPVRVESPTNLNATYNNGTAGVGATLTNAGTQAALVLDGVTVSVADRVLIYTQTTQTQNGIYVVTSVGSVSTNWVLTRSSDANTFVSASPTGLSEGSTFFVQQGTTGAGETYTCNTQGTIVFGTTDITFAQISSAQIYSAGTGLTLSGTQFSLTNPVATTLGGTGLATFGAANRAIFSSGTTTLTAGTLPVAAGGTGHTAYTDGQLLIGKSSDGSLTQSTLTQGTGITISNGSGAITVTNSAPDQVVALTGGGTTTIGGSYPSFSISSADQYVGTVTSVGGTGTVNGLTLTGSITTSGSLTLGGTLSVDLATATVTGTLPVANGGTGATTSTGSVAVVLSTSPTLVTPVLGAASATSIANGLGAVGTPSYTFTGDLNTGMWSPAADTLAFSTNGAEVGRFTATGYIEAVYADKVVALGNTGTSKTINLNLGNVFTATLTGNCTFTLASSNANSSRGSSFTLILTNDATPGRSVAWSASGGSFKFPGGAATLSRTTTANAIDIWVFFTPDNGTTYYGNISMKNMIA